MGAYAYGDPQSGQYLLVLLSFGMGVLSKPMVVTLPFVFCFSTTWPLRDLRNEDRFRPMINRVTHPAAVTMQLVVEEAPLFSWLPFQASDGSRSKGSGAVWSMDKNAH